jgi:hypothetical protein
MPSVRVPGFNPSTDELHFDNSFTFPFFVTIPGIGRVNLSQAYGLCGGMAYTVRDIFEARMSPPSTSSVPSMGSPLWNYIVRRLLDSLPPAMVARNIALSSPAMPDHDTWIARGRAWVMIMDEWPLVKADLDAGRPSPLGLIKVKSFNPIDVTGNHQVLAWGYDLNGDDLTLHLYDPNHHDEDVTLSLNIGNPTHTTPITYSSKGGGDGTIFMFFHTNYVFSDPSSIAAPRPAMQRFLLHTGTPIGEQDGAANFVAWPVADLDRDGTPDLYGIKARQTGTGTVEVHVLSGADEYRPFLLQTGTPIGQQDGSDNFDGWAVRDFNRDGVPELFCIKTRQTGTGNVEVHVLNGADNYQSFVLQTGIPIGGQDGSDNFDAWALGDFTGDGLPDLYGIKTRQTGTGNVEVHVLNGADNYQSFVLQTGIPIGEQDGSDNFGAWLLADLNRDGMPDLYGIKTKQTGTGKVEVHALGGAGAYQGFLLQVGTAIGEADGSNHFGGWALGDFNRDGVPELFGIKTSATGTGNVEVHILE